MSDRPTTEGSGENPRARAAMDDLASRMKKEGFDSRTIERKVQETARNHDRRQK